MHPVQCNFLGTSEYSHLSDKDGNELHGEKIVIGLGDFRVAPPSARINRPPGAEAPAARSDVGKICAFSPWFAAPHLLHCHVIGRVGQERAAPPHRARVSNGFRSLHAADHQRHLTIRRSRPSASPSFPLPASSAKASASSTPKASSPRLPRPFPDGPPRKFLKR